MCLMIRFFFWVFGSGTDGLTTWHIRSHYCAVHVLGVFEYCIDAIILMSVTCNSTCNCL